MYKRVTISNVEFEVEYSEEKPEFENGFCSYPGDIQISSIELNGVNVHELLCNHATGLLELITEKI